MHELGLNVRLTLNPDTPEERVLLDIPDWNFEWQFGYTPVEDIVIDSDDISRVECAWNRERAPYEAVGYILWADGTGDEMCYNRHHHDAARQLAQICRLLDQNPHDRDVPYWEIWVGPCCESLLPTMY